MFTIRFLFLRSLKLILAFLVLTGSAHAEIKNLTGEVWSVCGWDGISSWDDTRLIFTNQIDACPAGDQPTRQPQYCEFSV